MPAPLLSLTVSTEHAAGCDHSQEPCPAGGAPDQTKRQGGTLPPVFSFSRTRRMTKRLSLQDLTLLLVEPSPTQARIIRDHLVDVGLQHIEVVGTGADALQYMQQHIPDVVASAMYFP